MSTTIVSTGSTLTVTNGTLALSGDSTVGNGALLDGAGQVDSGLYALINDGTIAADDATGPLTLDPASLDNEGTIIALTNSLTIAPGVSVVNFNGTELSGGSWAATNNGTLVLSTAPIVTDDATIDLAGADAAILSVSNGATTAIQNSLTDIAAAGVLNLTDTIYTVSGPLTDDGAINLANGTLAIASGGTLSGSAVISGNGKLFNGGYVTEAPGGELTIGSGVSIANFANGTLTGGTWAALNGGTLILPTGSIVTDKATIDLSGTGEAILSVSNGATTTLENTLTQIKGLGVLNLTDTTYTVGGSLNVLGTIGLTNGTLTVEANGTLNGNGTVTGSGVLDNEGLVISTGALDEPKIESGVSIANFANGTLTGGTWAADGTGKLILPTGSIVTDKATIDISGAAAAILSVSNGATTALHDTLTDIAAAGVLNLTDITNYAVNGPLTDDGTINLTNSALTVEANGTLQGDGTITGAGVLYNFGVVSTAPGDALSIESGMSIGLFANGTLTDGTWAAFNGGTLILPTDPIVTDKSTIDLSGTGAAILSVSNGATTALQNTLTLIKGAGVLNLTDTTYTVGGSLDVLGTIGLTNSTLTIAAAGTLDGKGAVSGTGTLYNNGLVYADAGGSPRIGSGVSIANFANGTLTGGTWAVSNGESLFLPTGPIVTDTATIDLSGSNSAILSVSNGTTTDIQNSLTDIAAGGSLLLQNTTYTAGGSLTVAGIVTLDSAILRANSGDVTVAAGGLMTGTGTIAETGTIAGTGTLNVAANAIVDNSVAGGTLTIDPATLNNLGQISAFGGDVVVGSGVTVTQYTGGTLMGGGWSVDLGGTLTLDTAPITVDDASISMGYPGSAIITQYNGTTTAIQNSLTNIALGSSLTLLNRAYQAGGSLNDQGGISLFNGTLSALSGAISIGAGGYLDGTGTVISGGTLSNGGGITADQAGTLSIASGVSITNLSNGTLTGGEWSAFKNSTLLLSGGSITTDNGDISLAGPGGALVTQSNGAATPVDIQNSLTDIAVAGILDVSDTTYTPGGSLSVAGQLRLTQGILQDAAGGLDIAATGAVEGDGTITGGTLTVGGTILANHGTLTVASGLSTAQYNNGTLTGGTWGAFTVGTLALSTGPIRTDEAVISLSDQGWAIVTQSNGTTTALQNSLTDIGTAGQLFLTNTTYTAGGSLTVEGQVQLDNATLQGAPSGVTVAATGGFFGGGQDTITGGTLTVLGVVQSDSGTLTIESGLLNNQGWMGVKGGNLAIASGVSIANVSNGTLTGGLWAAGNGTLTLGAAPIATDDADIELNGTGVVVTGGGASGQNIQNTLTEIGTAGTLGLTDATFTSDQALTDNGAISLNNGTVSTAKLLTVGGIGVLHGAGTLTGTGTLTNEGVVSSDVSGTLDVGAGATITNFSNGTLTGGVWAATGASALVLTTDSIVTDDATLSLNGQGSAIYTQANGTAPLVNIDTSLTEVAAAGGLDLTNTSFTADNSLTVDGTVSLRNGTLDVIPTPSLVSGYDDVTIAAGGTIMGYGTLNTGLSVDDAGLIEASGGTLAISDGPSIDGAGTLAADATGTLLLGPDGGDYTQTIVNDGVVAVRSDPASQVHASTTIDGAYSGTGSVLIQGLTPGQGQTGLSLAGTISANVAFDANAGELEIQDPATYAGTISGFWDPDTIILDGIDATAATLSGGVLSLSDNGTVVDILSLNTASVDYSSVTFSIVDKPGVSTTVQVSGAQQAPCYREGTRIATADGEVPVESLKPGDIVLTLFSGPVPVVWAGRRRVDCARHPDPDKVLPILVKAHAFARGIPHSDLYLSPDHAVYVDDVLIPIHHLVNGRTIRQVVVEHVTYFHIELAEHDILLAEGLTAESYLENGDRQCFDNAGGVLRLHPEFGARRWETAGCAPLVITGPALRTVRERLARRAKDKRRRPSAA
jgi:hypothetical protein